MGESRQRALGRENVSFFSEGPKGGNEKQLSRSLLPQAFIEHLVDTDT